MGDAERAVWYALTLAIGIDGGRRGDGPWDPPLEMNRWLCTGTGGTAAGGPLDRPVVTPPVELLIDDDGMVLLADMPGIPKGNIDIRVVARQVDIIGVPPGEEHHGIRIAPDVAGLSQDAGRTPVGASGRSFGRPHALLRGGVLELRLPKGALLRGDDQGRIPVR